MATVQNAEVLESLRYEYPAVEMVLSYLYACKTYSTYCEGLLKVITEDGRIHSSFNQTETRTGRISSTVFQFTKYPCPYRNRQRIEKVFAAREGWVLIDADYSQIELRVLAHISGDKNMIEAFNTNADIHTITASQVFNMPVEMVNSTMRSRCQGGKFWYCVWHWSVLTLLRILK